MNRTWLYLAAAALIALVGAALFLYTWDIPAPSQEIEKTLPDDRFPR
ncbi:hypothetical protein [Rhodothalassium salexigens]|nr:hypothetical protein [Rhodothalassium salexigens]